MTNLVQLQQYDQLIEIVLNRPEKRNALNWALMSELDDRLSSVERMAGARVVLMRGEGAGFSAGIDLLGFEQMVERFGEGYRENLFPLTQAYQAILNKVEGCSLPVIALVHGFCMGLGFELALACDLRIAAYGTKMGLPETRLGLIPDVGGTTRLTRLVGAGRAKELIMTGRNIDMECAERWGIVNYVVQPDKLLDKGRELAREIAGSAPLAVSYTKRVIDGLGDIERGLQLEAWAQSVLIRSQDFEIGIQTMLTKTPPEWKGK